MISGLRAGDARLLHQLCGSDQRLLLRLGALLQERLAVTETVLAELARLPALRDLLMDRGLSGVTDTADLRHLAETRGCGGLDLALADGGAEADGPAWRVVAFADEIGNPLLAATAPAADAGGVRALLPTVSSEMRGPLEGFLAATADAGRAAALEQLRYAAPPLTLLAELMPMVLADGSEQVRERAIALLAGAGARPVVLDLIRALQKGDEASIRRLADVLGPLDPEQLDLVVGAVLASLMRTPVSPALVHLCTAIAGRLAGHRGLERLLGLLLPQAHRISLVGLVRALQAIDATRVQSLILAMAGQGEESDARLIILLARPGESLPDDLLARGVDLLLADSETPRDRMALAGALLRGDTGRTLAGRISSRPAPFGGLRDNAVFWLLAELCRSGSVDVATGTRLLAELRGLLLDARGTHVIALLEQELPVLLPAPAGDRAALVEPLGDLAGRLRSEHGIDLIRHTLGSLGEDAVAGCWRLVEGHPLQRVRELSAGVLPLLPVAGAPAIHRLLACARGRSALHERALLLTSAARIAGQTAADDRDLAAAIDAEARPIGLHAIPVWGHLAAAAAFPPDRRLQVVDLLLGCLTSQVPESPSGTTVDPATQETTYILDDRLSAHTETVPLVIEALERICASPALPAPLRRRVIQEMCRQWRLVATWAVLWGPANSHLLGAALARLAALPQQDGALRLVVVEALLPQVAMLPVARNLADIFAAHDGGDDTRLAFLAAGAARNLLTLAARGEFSDDEVPLLAETLACYLLIPHLGAGADDLRLRLASVLATHRSQVPHRQREALRATLAGRFANNPVLAERLSWL